MAAMWLVRRRAQTAALGPGRSVLVLLPPTVEPAGAVQLWGTLIALLRPPVKRLTVGQPHIGFEIVARRGALTFQLWVPDSVPPGYVERAVEAAWPGARTSTEPAQPPLPVRPSSNRSRRRLSPNGASDGRVQTGGRLRLARPAGYPLATEHPVDPLRPLLGALSGLAVDQAACVQLLARPVTGRRPARLRIAATRRSSPTTPGDGKRRLPPANDPFRSREVAALVAKAASPSFAVELRYAVATLPEAVPDAVTADQSAGETPGVQYAAEPDRQEVRRRAAALRGQAHAIASAFAVFEGLNGLRRSHLRRPADVLASRRLARGQLWSVAEVAAVAHLPLDLAVPGVARAGARTVIAPPTVPTSLPPQGRLDRAAGSPTQRLPGLRSGTHALSGRYRIPDSSPGGNPDSAAQSTSSLLPRVLATAGRAKVLGLDAAGRRVLLPAVDARQHLHVLGATGSGKSTLLTNLILDDVAAGRGVAVVDPKGDLITDLLDRLPATAAGRLALLDPTGDFVADLNPLTGADPQLAVDHLVGIFRRIYAGFWGPRTDDVLRSACLTLMSFAANSRQPASLLEVPRLLTNADFRRRITDHLDPAGGLSGFWQGYATQSDAAQAQIVGPLLNKLRAFLLRDFVRRTLTAHQPTIAPMDAAASAGGPEVAGLAGSAAAAHVLSGGVLLARLPKGLIGDDTSRLLGSFLLAQIWQAATYGARLGQDDRPDAALYIDECHNFLTLPQAFDDVLAEARGYRLSLVLAHQHLGQLPTDLRAAISANARNKIYFTVSPEDAATLERHTTPELAAHDLAHLAGYTAAARLVIGAANTPAFTLHSQPAPPPIPHRASQLRAAVAARQPDGPSTRELVTGRLPDRDGLSTEPTARQSGYRTALGDAARSNGSGSPATIHLRASDRSSDTASNTGSNTGSAQHSIPHDGPEAQHDGADDPSDEHPDWWGQQ